MEDIFALHQKELENFLRLHCVWFDDLSHLLSDAFDCKNGSPKKGHMLLQVQRFVSLADNIGKIAPPRDGLKILFLRICLESLQSISDCDKKVFYDTFADYFSDEGRNYILSHFKLLSFEYEYCGENVKAQPNITLLDFLWTMKAFRDQIVHNGDYWSTQFFASNESIGWPTSLKTDTKIIKSYQYRGNGNNEIEYFFETTLNYERFIHYFVEACVNYIQSATT